LELNKGLEGKKFMQINDITSYESNEYTELAKIGVCWFIHLRESIFYTFLAASSHQKSRTLQVGYFFLFFRIMCAKMQIIFQYFLLKYFESNFFNKLVYKIYFNVILLDIYKYLGNLSLLIN